MQRILRKKKQLGQGMTEYIIIVALIAVAAIAVYNLFGDTVRGQVGDMAAELGGGTSSNQASTKGSAAQTEGAAEYDLGNFAQEEGGGE